MAAPSSGAGTAGHPVAAAGEGIKGYLAAIGRSADPKIAAWQKLQFGMFVHWGIYSNHGGFYQGQQQKIGYPEQIKAWMNIPTSDYLNTAASFDAEKFDPQQWCATAKAAGAKYLVLTSKHHDGFAMWNTHTTDYNITAASALRRDPIAELSRACRSQGLGFGLYFSIIDWTKQTPKPYNNTNPIPADMMPYIQSQLREILTRYGTLDEIWFDMGAPTAEQSAAMAATVHRYQPTAMVNSRVWNDKGDFEVGGDNFVPAKQLQGPWQSAESVFSFCWGYCSWSRADRSAANLPVKVRTLVNHLFTVISGGGNYLLNVGPKGDGSIDPFDAAVFSGIGAWNQRHPDAVLDASATRYGRQAWGDSTVKGDAIYLGVQKWPAGGGDIRLPGVGSPVRSVTVDGTGTALPYRMQGADGTELVVTLPSQPTDPDLPVIKVSTVGAPLVIPETLVRGADQLFTITETGLTATYSPKDAGAQALRQTGWFADTAADGSERRQASVRVEGTFAPGTAYRVRVGDSSVVATGAQLSAGPVAGLSYPVGEVTPVSIELADPDYFADPLDATVTAITVDGR
nr:alpha-L-fucosidase [Nakamurella aerolata]